MKTRKRKLALFSKNTLVVGLLCSILLFTGGAALAAWEAVGPADFADGDNYSNLVFSGDTPYLAFRDIDSRGKAAVMRFSGGAWQYVGAKGFSDGDATDIALAFYNSVPYVAFADGTNSMKVTVMTFTGLSWEVVGNKGFSDGRAGWVNLAFSGSTPYVAFCDFANSDKVTVMRYSDDAWEVVGSKGFAADASDISLAFSGSTPYVAFMEVNWDTEVYGATVMKYNGTAWEAVGERGFSDGRAMYTSLAFQDAIPFVAYLDFENAMKATVMKYNGTAWEAVGERGFSDGRAMYTSLAFLGATPYVAYQDYGNAMKATVMRFNGAAWEAVGERGFSSGRASNTSLAFSGSTPYVAFADSIAAPYGGEATVMSYPPTTKPDPPVLTITTTGITVALSWTAGLHDKGYILSYAPQPYAGPETIVSTDMGGKTGLTIDLWEGAAFLVAVQAYNSFGTSEYSNIVQFILGQ